jgi:threonine/homoserine/homoserine lactone efflux protein
MRTFGLEMDGAPLRALLESSHIQAVAPAPSPLARDHRFRRGEIARPSFHLTEERPVLPASALIPFILASIAIILAPGPAQALVLARTLSDGRRAGIMTALGLNTGTIIHAFAAAVGVSAVLTASALAFAVVKYAGALYLLYLGIQALRSHPPAAGAPPPDRATAGQAFAKAVITGVLNPKVALFFLAFLPQFVDPARGPLVGQIMALGMLLAVMDTIYATALVWAIGAVRQRIAGSQRFAHWRQRITGAVLIGLGLRLALIRRD